MNWKEYQEETAKVFRSLGCKAEVECKLAGVRGEHEIDVLVTFERFGVISTWVIECKYWNSAISKDKILTLQSIVDDVGADRGIFISKSGYQSGAFKQAEKSNITLTSLEEFVENAKEEFREIQLKTIEVKLIKTIGIYDKLCNPTFDYSYGFLEYGFSGMEGQKAMVFNYYLKKAYETMKDLKTGIEKYTYFIIEDYSGLNMNQSLPELETNEEKVFLKYLQELVSEALCWADSKEVVNSLKGKVNQTDPAPVDDPAL